MNYFLRWTDLKALGPNDVIVIVNDAECLVINEDAVWLASKSAKFIGVKYRMSSRFVHGNEYACVSFPHGGLSTVVDTINSVERRATIMTVHADRIAVNHRTITCNSA